MCTSLFCSQVFKTSDVLNSDENIVNIALIAFISARSAGGDKVGSLADVEFTLVWCGSLADSLLQLSFVLALL